MTGVQTCALPISHQADTYDYEVKSGVFTVTHAVNGNLGRFVLDTVRPLIELGTKQTGASAMDTVEQYFSTLQAAVDAAEDGKMIEINSNYKGSTTINMTGKARTIYIQANGKNVVVANASGGTVDENSKGSFYTIKLNRDNTVTANAVVSVGSASNGSASVDTTIAKPGSSVSGKYTASSGYKAGSFTATAQPGNKSVSVSVSANGTFSFTVPSDDISRQRHRRNGEEILKVSRHFRNQNHPCHRGTHDCGEKPRHAQNYKISKVDIFKSKNISGSHCKESAADCAKYQQRQKYTARHAGAEANHRKTEFQH